MLSQPATLIQEDGCYDVEFPTKSCKFKQAHKLNINQIMINNLLQKCDPAWSTSSGPKISVSTHTHTHPCWSMSELENQDQKVKKDIGRMYDKHNWCCSWMIMNSQPMRTCSYGLKKHSICCGQIKCWCCIWSLFRIYVYCCTRFQWITKWTVFKIMIHVKA